MANKRRGYYTLKLGGKNRTMHFSMNFWANFTDELNISLEKIGEVFSDGVSISSIRALVYSGLKAYDQEEGNEIDYNQFKVGVWLEDFQAEKLNEMIEAMMESRILGNDLNMGVSRNVKKTTKVGANLQWEQTRYLAMMMFNVNCNKRGQMITPEKLFPLPQDVYLDKGSPKSTKEELIAFKKILEKHKPSK